MATVPVEAVQKILLEIEEKAASSRQQLQIVVSQLASRNKDSRIIDLTKSELAAVTPETNVYEGVGKMFVQTSRENILSRLDGEKKLLQAEIKTLSTRQHSLETTLKNTQAGLERFLGTPASSK